ncbi:hypothetical protein HDV00_002746 [Rhizophlyctis rosea]|nr:hypothetical protein HDV00_002746 [Rhizophlyctis rosea]
MPSTPSAYYSQIPTVRCRDCGEVLQFGKKHRCEDLDLRPTRRPKQAPGDGHDDDDYGRGRNGHGGEDRDRERSRNRDRGDRERGGPTRPPRDRSRPREDSHQPQPNQRSKSRTRDQQNSRRRSPREDEPHSPGSGGSGEKKGGIDNLMADLMNEMHMEDGRDSGYDQDDRDAPKCGGCNQSIKDPTQAFEIPALSKLFHVNCFRCRICKSTFSEENPYVPHEGHAYCERDYEDCMQRICAKCNKPIFSRPVYALNKVFHSNHLRCHHCRHTIHGNPYEHNGHVYCEKDYFSLCAARCATCQNPIEGETIYALDKTYHKDCFVCVMCGVNFPDKSFYVWEAEQVCRRHYHMRNGSLCGGCDAPIEGPCAEVAELNKRYHPDCWCCALCRAPLTTTYYSYAGKAYCEEDIQRVYSRQNKKFDRSQRRQTMMRNL